mmetsp:Transcript_10333/g.29012  ORF Transcript_10333/g.29012 Transcript_10333/m.29012 type:complete len:201 (-) Transcript_10333:1614-2216(-)
MVCCSSDCLTHWPTMRCTTDGFREFSFASASTEFPLIWLPTRKCDRLARTWLLAFLTASCAAFRTGSYRLSALSFKSSGTSRKGNGRTCPLTVPSSSSFPRATPSLRKCRAASTSPVQYASHSASEATRYSFSARVALPSRLPSCNAKPLALCRRVTTNSSCMGSARSTFCGLDSSPMFSRMTSTLLRRPRALRSHTRAR